MTRPESIENRWDILYRDYPDVYEAFSRVKRVPQTDMAQLLGVKGKIVADIGSGTGKSSFAFAPVAKQVFGVEPETAMLKIAEENLKKLGYKNVVFMKGSHEHIPLPAHSVDIVSAVTSVGADTDKLEVFTKEAERVLVKGGRIVSVDVAPESYGGDLYHIVWDKQSRRENEAYNVKHETLYKKLGFAYRDFLNSQVFDSVEHIVSTYGFIFGKKAIEYIKANNITTIKWTFRIHEKVVS